MAHEGTTSNSEFESVNRHDIKGRVRNKLQERFYRSLDYLSSYAFLLIIYGGFLFTEHSLFSFVDWLLHDTVAKFRVAKQFFEFTQLGLALLVVINALVHGILSTISLIKIDLATSKEIEGCERGSLHN
jgi:hypothetical protein